MIAAVILLQPNVQRIVAAAIFFSVTMLHDTYLSHHDGLAYYSSAAILDLVLLAMLGFLKPATKTIVQLQTVCILSIMANFAGWVLWMLYLSPIYYNGMFVCIYTLALFVLLEKEGRDVGIYTLDSWRLSFFGDRHSRIFDIDKHGDFKK